jgi:hypothetical protein
VQVYSIRGNGRHWGKASFTCGVACSSCAGIDVVMKSASRLGWLFFLTIGCGGEPPTDSLADEDSATTAEDTASCDDPGPEVCGDGVDQACDGQGAPGCPWGTVPLDEAWHRVTFARPEHLFAGEAVADGAASLVVLENGVYISLSGLEAGETDDVARADYTIDGGAVSARGGRVADIAGDGVADLVLTGQYEDGRAVFAVPLDGTRTTVAPSDAVLLGITFGEPLTADFDADGVLDVGAPDQDATSIDGIPETGGFLGSRSSDGAPFAIRGPTNLEYLAFFTFAADLDGDGDDDLVATSGARGSFLTHLLAGPFDAGDTSVLDADTVLTEPEETHVPAATGDFDGDGYTDLLMMGTEDGVYTLGVVHGPVPSGAHVVVDLVEGTVRAPPGAYQFMSPVVTCNFEGDGRADVLVSSSLGDDYYEGAYAIFGPFAGDRDLATDAPAGIFPATTAGGGANAPPLACLDVDGDGFDEAVVSQDESLDEPAGLIGVFHGPGGF